ncbi:MULTISPECIES: DMT family transporter [Amycolatopsis]|uniref:SMR family transporter n=1 Tax=Amycolatopsis thermalba TaxID=944492 RepID=A0ABY4NMC4_9PSEU|nr:MULTISPECIES: SMR family transporter [Amycolatopsis]OXM70116.1 QacE family quaternary ammonium compound efflux SMR transporter [Amycolatopsis sp. KNN50.9b]UQS21461.1 SMR family transporter [Amycolatopsis thermalba]
MVAYILLALAIAAEVTATVSMKLSEGFTKLWPSVVVVAGYLVAFAALASVLKRGMPVGVAYAIWAAVGVAAVAIIGVLFLGEPVNLTIVAGLALVIGGVVLIEVGSA